MSTLSFQLDNIDSFDPDVAPDADEPPCCPDCDVALTWWHDHFECVNANCDNCNVYQVQDGQLVKIGPAF